MRGLSSRRTERRSQKRRRARRYLLYTIDTSNMTVHEVAIILSVTDDTARRDLKALGRTIENGGYKREDTTGPRYHLRKYDWDRVKWPEEFNSQIAAKLGCDPAVVSMTRRRQGHPQGPDGRRVSPVIKMLRECLWKEREIAITAALRSCPLTTHQISERVHLTLDTTRKTLLRMHRSRLVERERLRQQGGCPYIYRLPHSNV